MKDDRTVPHDPQVPKPPAAQGAWRIVEISERRVVTHALPARGAVTLGRSADAGITVDDPKVSRLHATITVGDTLSLTDLGSSNGTRVRDQALASGETVALHAGDHIDLGATLLVLQCSAQAGAPLDAWAPVSREAPAGMRDDVLLEAPAMVQLRRLVERIAPGVISVLLLGETGVGKEVFAEMVHRRSRRASGPFVRIHGAALNESLWESELFGHERGAFTGASEARAGLLEAAQGGTVFIDEVGELPPSLQVKLLRVIEERRVTRVGSTRPRDLDVRFVSATHRDLEREVAEGRFRQDLYFRLNGIALHIPPLRARVSEIEGLARLFLSEACRRSGLDGEPVLSAEALDALRAHPWPGNLRELRNLMERAALLCADGVITPEHLAFDGARVTVPAGPPSTAPTPDARALRDDLAAMEKQRILDALARCNGNQTQAAAMLQMARRTLVTRLGEYGLTRPRR